MAITDKKYLDNDGLSKTLENLNEQFNGTPFKKILDATKSAYYLFDEYKGTSVNYLIKYDDTSNVTNMDRMFINCSNLITVPLLDTSNVTDMSSMFYNCRSLTTIPALDTSNVTDMSSMFSGCSNLTKISMLNIGTDLNISSCTKMEREALLEVLGNLKDLTSSTSKKLTLGRTLLAKLTDDDKAIATNKNWTLA